MNTQFRRLMTLPTIDSGALTLAARNTFGLGGDYSNDRAISQPAWPVGMSGLVNSKNRIDGRFIGVEDVFYFAGTAQDFDMFLKDYASIREVEKHQLILHQGKGEAGSAAGSSRRFCDWKLRGRPGASRLEPDACPSGYLLEVHFWTEGRIALDEVCFPKNIEVINANLAVG